MSSQRLEQGALLNGRYAIQEVVGRGGMGTVYRALDTRLEIVVAVKEMTEKNVSFEERATAIRQFEREAKMLGQLQHLNLPRVTDYFVEEDHCYLIMEFVVGETLDAKLREAKGAPLPLPIVLDWSVQIADVLTYLHGQDPPIVFRDVKPANIMVQADGTVKLIDFGIARRFTAGATKDTLLYGSPGYSPPEQYGRAQTDPRADIYAMGATLHHLVTGRDPAATPFRFPAIRALDPLLPQALETFISRCVEMDEEKRIQSAEEARDTLVHIRTASLLTYRPAPEPTGASARPRGPVPGENSRRTTAPRVVSSRVQRAQERALARRLGLSIAVLLVVSAVGAIAYKSFPRQAPANPKQAPKVIVPPVNPTVSAPVPEKQQETTGWISLSTDPIGAEIHVDGKSAGKTPLDIPNLAPGRHVFRFVPSEGSGLVEATRVVEIVAGQNRDILTVLLGSPSSSGDQPLAQLGNVAAKTVTGERPESSGVRISLNMRVHKGQGKEGVVGIFFYSPDGKPMQPARGVTGYQSQDGQLAAFSGFHVEADTTDFPDFPIFVPLRAFPPDTTYDKVTYRIEAFLDNKLVGQTDLMPLVSRTPP
jgi:serine/threonine protein kinase